MDQSLLQKQQKPKQSRQASQGCHVGCNEIACAVLSLPYYEWLMSETCAKQESILSSTAGRILWASCMIMAFFFNPVQILEPQPQSRKYSWSKNSTSTLHVVVEKETAEHTSRCDLDELDREHQHHKSYNSRLCSK